MNMDLRSLRYAVGLARRLNFTKAADELGVSQSALSRSIQELERRSAARLFDRDRGGVHLTAVGRLFVERAAALLREADDLDRFLRRAAGGAEGEIAFGMAPLPASALLEAVLRQEMSSNPDLHIDVSIRIPQALLPLLLTEKIEFFLGAQGAISASASVIGSVLGSFPVSLVTRAGHPLLDRKASPDSHSFPVIVSGRFDETMRFPGFNSYLKGRPRIVIEDYAILAHITETSDALWLTSSYAARDAISSGRLVEIPPASGQPSGRIPIMIYSLDRRSLSPVALRLKERFRAQIRALSESPKRDRPLRGGSR
jgi:DNA-binding transcriptional LysR family regulator